MKPKEPFKTATAGAVGSSDMLEIVIKEWMRRGRVAVRSAERQRMKPGSLLIEHGAMTYLECATELREVLQGKKPDYIDAWRSGSLTPMSGVRPAPSRAKPVSARTLQSLWRVLNRALPG